MLNCFSMFFEQRTDHFDVNIYMSHPQFRG